ncbi:choice-of-anchor G family protein [Compostimonas suwonensis]|uniref:Choice-of-anchor G family protein n=1 Tax=Compostimonas suwonensis TaxID=1048394 RepID=A0A2M9BCE7_9MICO|nr:choice-of-anchor G family protein [Compostimonas suwonensis]PJJ55629.1 hypothetical protein CLV54_2976 [Compostimonas suwonensis]
MTRFRRSRHGVRRAEVHGAGLHGDAHSTARRAAHSTAHRARRRVTSAGIGLGAGAAMVALLGAAALSPNVAASVASWSDAEWSHGIAGTLDCEAPGTFTSRGSGAFLGGGILPIPTQDIADLNAVTVTNDGSASTVEPASANPLGSDAYINPLQVDALNGLVSLDLTNLLVLPLQTDSGAINEYGQAQSTGRSAGATGLINDSGGIAVDEVPATIPDWATLKLSTLVSEVTGDSISDLVGGIADVGMSLGAIGSSAQYDACNAEFADDLEANLEREYLVAGLSTTATSPLVGDLTTTVDGVVGDLETAVNGLVNDSALQALIEDGVGGLVDGVLGLLGLGSVSAEVSATIDLSAVESLLTETLSDTAGVVTVSLTDGTVLIDLAALVGGPDGLNGLDPNTELLINDEVINQLTETLGDVLDSWVQRVLDAVDLAVAAVRIDASAVVNLTALGTNVATITATLDDVSLAGLLDGTTHATAEVTDVISGGVLGGLLGALCALPVLPICGLTTGLITTIANTVAELLVGTVNTVSGLGGIVGGAVDDILAPIAATLGSTLATVTAPLVTAVSQLYGLLFGSWEDGTGGLFSIGVNIQNAPSAPAYPAPVDWTTGPDAIPPGQYDVAAIRIGVLDALGASTNLNLDLARSSVGPNLLAP